MQDAFCPHLGAHLGHGGTVDDCQIVCPFHGWKFDADGTNTEIPYSERTNKKGTLRTFPVVERNGLCFAWYHPDAEVGERQSGQPRHSVGHVVEAQVVAVAVVEETRAFLNHHLSKAAPTLKDVTQSTQSFVSDALGVIYGTASSGATKLVDLDPAQRLGIFTLPAVS